jgi:transcriptional regulator of acetoin/glycerol metabolism
LRQHTGGRPPPLESKLVEALALYDWPLNARELLLLARRLLAVHGSGEPLKKMHLPDRMLAPIRTANGAGPVLGLSHTPAEGRQGTRRKISDEAEFEALVGALRTQGGSVAKAAAAIGVSRARAYRLLSAHPDFSLDPTDP